MTTTTTTNTIHPHKRLDSLATLDSAVQALQRLAQQYPSPPTTTRIIKHMQHCCKTLTQLHQSLHAGLDCLQYTVFPRMLLLSSQSSQSQSSSSLQPDVWLPLWLQYIIRLHDGLILCISGECRSAYDQKKQQQQQQNNNNTFKSHLPKSSHTYQAKNRVYSGASWDEWNDPDNGLVKRYLQSIRKSRTWWENTILRNQYYSALELFWNQLEQEQQLLQQRFRDWQCKILPQQLLQIKITKVQLLFTDKMEQLKRLQQSNNNNNNTSVLPLEWQSPKDWESAFSTWSVSLTGNYDAIKKKKQQKRRRIVGDDEEEGSESNTKKKTSSSIQKTNQPVFKVRIHNDTATTTTTTAEDTTTTSVLQLKQQFGVDATKLEESHAFVQAEERQTRVEGQKIDQDPTVLLLLIDENDNDVDAAAEQTLETTTMRLQRFRQILEQLLLLNQRKENHDTDDDDLIWNAREHVRQLAMEVGNQCLWYPARKELHLKQAHQMFRLAQTMVLQSQSSAGNDSLFYQRTLCLVLGQAQTNMGIVCVEQKKYRAAIQQLQIAVATARQLLEMTQNNSSDSDSSLAQHQLQAWQLFSLTMRWSGVAHWHLRRREQAQSCWKEAASCLSQVASKNQAKFRGEYRALVVKCITAWVVCADMFRQALHVGGDVSDVLQSYYDTAQNALREAVGLARLLDTTDRNKDDEDEEDIVYDPKTLKEAATELEQWWKARQHALQVRLTDAPSNERLERSDVLLAPPPPTHRLVWNPQSQQRRKKKKKKLQSEGGIRSAEEVSNRPLSNTNRVTERAWGDGLFPKTSEGKPKLPAGCGPPPLDPELAVQAQRLGIVIPQF